MDITPEQADLNNRASRLLLDLLAQSMLNTNVPPAHNIPKSEDGPVKIWGYWSGLEAGLPSLQITILGLSPIGYRPPRSDAPYRPVPKGEKLMPIADRIGVEFTGGLCPDCGCRTIMQSGCELCPNCGYDRCG